MFRKVALLIATGTLCVIAGIFDRRLVADDCPNVEVDTGIYCPPQIGDNPNSDCASRTKATCEATRYSKLFDPNQYATKVNAGKTVILVYKGFPPVTPVVVHCYERVYCKWDATNDKCLVEKTEPVNQFVWQTVPCKGGEDDPG